MNADVKDKRKHKRYDIRDLAFVGAAIGESDMQHFAGIVVDISREGIGLHFPANGFENQADFAKLFHNEDPVRLRLQLMNSQERFEVTGEIKWTGLTDHIKSHPYSIGCYFSDCSELPQSIQDRFE